MQKRPKTPTRVPKCSKHAKWHEKRHENNNVKIGPFPILNPFTFSKEKSYDNDLPAAILRFNATP